MQQAAQPGRQFMPRLSSSWAVPAAYAWRRGGRQRSRVHLCRRATMLCPFNEVIVAWRQRPDGIGVRLEARQPEGPVVDQRHFATAPEAGKRGLEFFRSIDLPGARCRGGRRLETTSCQLAQWQPPSLAARLARQPAGSGQSTCPSTLQNSTAAPPKRSRSAASPSFVERQSNDSKRSGAPACRRRRIRRARDRARVRSPRRSARTSRSGRVCPALGPITSSRLHGGCQRSIQPASVARNGAHSVCR